MIPAYITLETAASLHHHTYGSLPRCDYLVRPTDSGFGRGQLLGGAFKALSLPEFS